MTRLGVLFRPQRPPEDLIPHAIFAEEHGIDEFWIAEDCFLSGGVSAASTALSNTSSIRVGIGILPVPLRNVALTAMEVNTLARLFPGRLTIGLGHGWQPWMQQVGSNPQSPIRLLSGQLTCIRRLLRGERIDFRSDETELQGVQLGHICSTPPAVLAGVTGPRGLHEAALHAEGIILPEGSSPLFVDHVRRTTEHHRSMEGLTHAWTVVVYALFALTTAHGGKPARLAAKDALTKMHAEHMMDNIYLAEQEVAGSPASDADRAVWGTPEQCVTKIKLLRDAGADSVVLVPLSSNPDHEIAQLMEAQAA